MSQWEERYKSQPMHGQVKNLVEKLKSIQPNSEDLQAVENHHLLLHISNYIALILKSTDPLLVNQSLVNQLSNANSQLSNVTSQIDAYISSPNSSNLAQAVSYIEGVLDSLRGLPQRNTKNVSDLLENISQYRTSFEGLTNDFAQRRDAFVENFQSRAEEFEGEVNLLKTQLTDVERRTQELRQLAEQQTQRVDNLLSTSQSNFLQDQTARQTNFQSEIKDFSKEFDSLVEGEKEKADSLFQEFTNKSSETFDAFSSQASERIDALDNMKEQARKILDIIGSDTVTGKYGQIANEEKQQANRFRIWAFVFLGITLIISGWIAISAHIVQPQPWEIISRIFFASISGTAAGYAINESRSHRKNERKNRKFELELAAIDPYLALFEVKERNELKARLAEKFFAQAELQGSSKEDENVSSNTLIQLIETVLKNLPKS